MSSGTGKLVCVTGASGYIASWLVKFLLQRGYTVRASVRDPTLNSLSLSVLYKERLHLFKENLLEEGSFDTAIQGCEGVFHTASPFYLDVKDPEAELLDPAVKGTLNVLNSCTKSASVRQVVLTSSIAAVANNGRPRTPDVVVDETWFSDPEICKEAKLWYVLSKTLAEEAAWKFAKESGLAMVAINPAMVTRKSFSEYVGSLTFSGNVRESNHMFVKGFTYGMTIDFNMFRTLMEYRISGNLNNTDIISMKRSEMQLRKTKCADDKPFVPTFQVSKEKAKSLGIEFIPLDVSLKETVDSLKEKNLVNF
ncbi:hypothetical protein I3760_14G120000 [Carya illinoinensis]|nr:hypothetical protein I3760_14G120000 [Carya illinoinensis]